MRSFEELGLREELLHTLEDEDLSLPTALQSAVIPALRRGGNVVARASSGAGKTLAYGLGILDRLKFADPEGDGEALDEGDGGSEPSLRFLVLTATMREAERVALALVPYAQALGAQVSVPVAAWGTAATEAAVLVAPARELIDAVQSSTVKLERVESIVIDGASAVADLGDLEKVDVLLDLLPRDAQRVVLSTTFPAAIEDLIDRRVKRALRYPPTPADPEANAVETSAGTIGFVVIAEHGKFDLLAGQLRQREAGSPPPVVFCRSDERAADLAERLAVRGFLIGQPDEEDANVAIVAGDTSRGELLEDLEDVADLGQTISYDVPADAASLRARHGGDPDGVVLVEPRELAHLHEIARQGGFQARSAPSGETIPGISAELGSFRSEVRATIEQEDLAAQMLILEPLLDEFNAVEVAAAVTALLRRRRSRPSETPVAASTPAGRPAPEKGSSPGPAPATWARLYVSLGSRDGARPGDIVGALAGEANVPGSRIGKIEIRDSFSIVEVQADVADQVIRAVNGTTIKGRSVRVDYDRGGPERRPAPRGAPRRTTRRPPQ